VQLLRPSKPARRPPAELLAIVVLVPVVLGLLLVLSLPTRGGKAAAGTTILATYDRSGHGPGQLHQPRALAVAPGHLFVADRTGRVLRFRADHRTGQLTYRDCFVMPLVANGYPAAIHYEPDLGTLLVGETHYGRVARYTPEGREVYAFGRIGRMPGEFERIQGLATNRDGDIFVCDYYGHTDRVQVFDQQGVFLRQWGGRGSGAGQLNRPSGLAVSDRGLVYVADAVNHRIQIFTEQGAPVARWTSGTMEYPYDVGLDGSDNLYAIDLGSCRLRRFTPEGVLVARTGGPGAGPGEFAQPWGLAVTADGLVYVADTRNHRIVALRLEPDTGVTLAASGGREE
jgi:tripartite motif-containing protein 71